MNFKEFMDALDKIWDEHNRMRLAHPESSQFNPERWKIKICTSEDNLGPVSSVNVKGVCAGFDWDDGNILIWADEPLYKERKD